MPGTQNLYNTCIDYQRYASALALNTNTSPTTRVSQDGMKISFNEHTLDITIWRTGLQQLASEIKSELAALCRGQESFIKHLSQVHNDWTNKERGYGWTTTDTYLDDPRCLLKVMLEDSQRPLARVENNRLVLSTAEGWAFIHKCDSVNEKLALLAFLTAGQTPRATEFVGHKYANSTRPRTIFRDADGLWLTTRRTKTEQLTHKESFLPIKCHPLLTQYLEQYLLVVRPVEADLVHFLKGDDAYHIYKEYMWTRAGGRMTAEHMYDFFRNFMTSYCEVPIGIHDYRQIAVEIGRVFLGSEFEVDEEERDVLAEQAGHSARMAHLKYAAEVGHLPSMSSDLLLRYGHISEAWWAVTGFKPDTPPTLPLRLRARLRPDHPHPESANPSVINGSTSDTSMGQMQALITSLFSEIQQLRGDIKREVRSAVGEALAAKQASRHSTHCSAQHDVTATELNDRDSMYSTLVPSTTQQSPPTLPSLNSAPYDPAPATSGYLHALLSKHFPLVRNPQFKSRTQMEAVEMSLARKENFVAVLPTGAGKSLIFTLPPFNEDGFSTYVIVPNKALLQDQLERAERVGLRTCVWKASRSSVPKDIQLVFLAMESAVSQRFNE